MAYSPILPVKIGELFATKTLKKFYGKAVAPVICNTNYEPIVSQGGADRVHILSFLNSVTLTDYTAGADMSEETWLGDVEDDLVLDEKKYFNFEIDDLNKFEAYATDIDSNLVDDAAGILQQTIDSFVLEYGSKWVKAGHRIGSDALRGSFVVHTGGAVVGSVDTDAAGSFQLPDDGNIAGLGFKIGANGTWYRISAFTDSTNVTITDWNGSTYSGSDNMAGIAYVEAYTALVVTTSNIYANIVKIATELNKDNIPTDNRWIVVHPDIGSDLRQASELIPAVAAAYEKVVENGLLGYISGMKVYESNQIRGNNSDGYHCVAGHMSFMTFAHTFKRSRIVESEDRFAKKYQGLNVYGVKTPIPRRTSGAMLFCTT